MKITKQCSTTNTTASKGRKIDYIVIHYTAGTSSAVGKAASTAKYFANETVKASADYIVDDEAVIQYNQDINNRYTWHCGGSKLKTQGGQYYNKCTNKNSIGVEICSNNVHKKVLNANDESWYFTDEAIANAVELVRELMKEYDVPAENVIRHYDVTGKLCPGVYGWNIDSGDESEWEDFKNRISPRDDSVGAEISGDYDGLLQKYAELKAKYDAIVEIVNS